MARTNWEDRDEKNPRFEPLVELLMERYSLPLRPAKRLAKGTLSDFWGQAIEPWGGKKLPRGKLALSRAEFDRGNYAELLEAGWAVEYDDGVQAHDAETRFAWYFDLCEHNRRITRERTERQAAEKAAREGPKEAGTVRSPDGNRPVTDRSPDGNRPVTDRSPDGNRPVAARTPDGNPLTLSLTLGGNSHVSEASGNPQAGRQQPPPDESPAPELADYGEVTKQAKPPVFRYKPLHLQLAHSMHRSVGLKNPGGINERSKPEAWANELRLLQDDEQVSDEELILAIGWVFNHPWWQTRVESPDSLRSNWAEIREQRQKERKKAAAARDPPPPPIADQRQRQAPLAPDLNAHHGGTG